MRISGMQKLRKELEYSKSVTKELQKLHSEMVNSCEALTKERDQLKAELSYTQELLASARAAKENDCLRGRYCRYCKHSVLDYTDRERCVCTYGTCPHFEKEIDHEPN